jgi:hypothetical protein
MICEGVSLILCYDRQEDGYFITIVMTVLFKLIEFLVMLTT